MSGTLIASTDCSLYRVPYAEIVTALNTDTDFSRDYRDSVSTWLGGALLGSIINSQMEVASRIRLFLQMLAHRENHEIETGYFTIGHKISHEFISQFVNATRVTVSTMISEMQKTGDIKQIDGMLAVSGKLFRENLYR